MVHVHPRWPVLILEVVESSGAVEEEDTEVVVAVDLGLVEDTEEVEDTRVVEVASEEQEVIVVAGVGVGVDTGGMVGVGPGDLVDTEGLMGVEDIEEVEDMGGGDSEVAQVGGAETGVVIKAEAENYICFMLVLILFSICFR